MSAAVETISDIAPLQTRFRYATCPEMEWGRIEAQTIHWPSAPVEGGRIEARIIFSCAWLSAPPSEGGVSKLKPHAAPPDPPVSGLLRVF